MFHRSKLNPILKPTNLIWENKQVYNPAVIYENGLFKMFYRARDEDNVSVLGYAESKNGETWQRQNKPRLIGIGKFEKCGVEDPRLVKIEDKYYLTYTAFDGWSARLSLATSNDLVNWQRHGILFPHWQQRKHKAFIAGWDNLSDSSKPWTKSGGIIPKKIKDRYYMLFGDSLIWLASSDDGFNWQVEKEILKPRSSFFDSYQLEMGPPPIETPFGWLVLYHGIDKQVCYRLGFFLLDLNNPRKIIKRSRHFLFEPLADYELINQADVVKRQNNKINSFVIFVCGSVLVNKFLYIFYGAGDQYICTAKAELNKILSSK